LLRLNLSFENIRAQCYDGASSMSGVHAGVQRWIFDLQPKVLYTHCRNHVLNLALQDASSCVRCVRDILSLTNDLANFSEILPRELAYLNQPYQQPYAVQQFPMIDCIRFLPLAGLFVPER